GLHRGPECGRRAHLAAADPGEGAGAQGPGRSGVIADPQGTPQDATREALEDMVWQFAHRVVVQGRPALTTGGLSALEHAFDVLGWDDPHFAPECDEQRCQEPGCPAWSSCGVNTADGYKRLCHEHVMDYQRAGRLNWSSGSRQ